MDVFWAVLGDELNEQLDDTVSLLNYEQVSNKLSTRFFMGE